MTTVHERYQVGQPKQEYTLRTLPYNVLRNM